MTPAPITRTVPLNHLSIVDDLQCRAALSEEAVQDYAEAYRNGALLPPLAVVETTDSRLFLVDGFHRHEAARLAGLTQLPCMITIGTEQDARWAAAGANATHGLRRTRQDKVRAVERALALRPELSDRAIASHTGTSHPFVAAVRRTLSPAPGATGNDSSPEPAPDEPPRRIGLDGRARSIPEPRQPDPGPPAEPAADQAPGLMDKCRCGHMYIEHEEAGARLCIAKGCRCKGFATAYPTLADGTPANSHGVYPDDASCVEYVRISDQHHRSAAAGVAPLADGVWVWRYSICLGHHSASGPLSHSQCCASRADAFRAAATCVIGFLVGQDGPFFDSIRRWAKELIDHEPPAADELSQAPAAANAAAASPEAAAEPVPPAAEDPGDDKIPEGAHLFYGDEPLTRPWPDPDPAALHTPEFNAVWQCIKDWDIAVPGAYHGYCGATGNHVRAILDALDSIRAGTTAEAPAVPPADDTESAAIPSDLLTDADRRNALKLAAVTDAPLLVFDEKDGRRIFRVAVLGEAVELHIGGRHKTKAACERAWLQAKSAGAVDLKNPRLVDDDLTLCRKRDDPWGGSWAIYGIGRMAGPARGWSIITDPATGRRCTFNSPAERDAAWQQIVVLAPHAIEA